MSKIQDSDYEQVKALYLDEHVRHFLGGVVDESDCHDKHMFTILETARFDASGMPIR